jgi:uncharacterized membrane protein YuzA (DUF378 family)
MNNVLGGILAIVIASLIVVFVLLPTINRIMVGMTYKETIKALFGREEE